MIQSIITLAAQVTWHRRHWLRLGRVSPRLPVLKDVCRLSRTAPIPPTGIRLVTPHNVAAVRAEDVARAFLTALAG